MGNDLVCCILYVVGTCLAGCNCVVDEHESMRSKWIRI